MFFHLYKFSINSLCCDRVMMVVLINGTHTIHVHHSAVKSGEKVKAYQTRNMKGEDRKC